MPEPNPIWGIHLAAGSLAAVCVQRLESGGYEVLERTVQRTGLDPADAVDAAVALLGRKGVRNRAAFLALPDSSGCLVTGHVPPEDADLTDHELIRELFDHTQFEPLEAQLRFNEFPRQGRARSFVIAALPVGHLDSYVNRLAERDFSLFGLGFASSATVRGARALGVVRDETYLLEVLPHMTHVTAIEGEQVHRYSVPCGDADLAAATSAPQKAASALAGAGNGLGEALSAELVQAATPLADDVRAAIAYHRELHRGRGRPMDQEDTYARARLVPVGPRTTAAGLARVLAAAFGDWIDTAPGTPTTPVTGQGADLAVVGALGAALEAFDTELNRLALRPPPDEVPEYKESSSGALLAAMGVAAAAVAGFVYFGQGDTPPADPPVRRAPDGSDDPPAVGWRAGDRMVGVLGQIGRRVAAADALRACARALNEVDPPCVATALEISRDEATGGFRVELTLVRADGAPAESSLGAALTPLIGREYEPDSRVQDGVIVTTFTVAPPLIELESPGEPIEAGGLTSAANDTVGLAGAGGADKLRAALEAATGAVTTEEDRFSVAAPLDAVLGALEAAVAGLGSRSLDGISVTASGEHAQVTLTAPAHGLVPAGGRVLSAEARTVLGEWLSGLRPEGLTGRFGDAAAAGSGSGLAVLGTRDAAAVLTVEPGAAGRVLERRAPTGPGWMATSIPVPEQGGDLTDDRLPGPPGRYAWRLRLPNGEAGEPVARNVGIATSVLPARGQDLSGTDAQCRFVIQRNYGGAATEQTTAPLAPGDLVATTGDPALTTGWSFEGFVIGRATETVQVHVPRFGPDGKARRTPDGAPVTVVREVERSLRVVSVRLRNPAGEVTETRLEK